MFPRWWAEQCRGRWMTSPAVRQQHILHCRLQSHAACTWPRCNPNQASIEIASHLKRGAWPQPFLHTPILNASLHNLAIHCTFARVSAFLLDQLRSLLPRTSIHIHYVTRKPDMQTSVTSIPLWPAPMRSVGTDHQPQSTTQQPWRLDVCQ